MKLAELQREFFARISSPAPIGDERLNVYGQMYFHRLRDVLREDFPAVRAILEDDFDRVAAEYIEKNPSQNPSLRRFGDRFPDHLSGALRDLARLERARSDAFDAENAEPLRREAIATLGPDTVLGLVFSARLLHVSFGVEGAWLAVDRGERVPSIHAADCTLLVWRRGFVVAHRAITGAEMNTLEALGRHATFATVCEILESPDVAARTIDQWISDELLMAK